MKLKTKFTHENEILVIPFYLASKAEEQRFLQPRIWIIYDEDKNSEKMSAYGMIRNSQNSNIYYLFWRDLLEFLYFPGVSPLCDQ